MEGRPIVREASLAEFKKNPKFAEEMAETPELPEGKPEPEPEPEPTA